MKTDTCLICYSNCDTKLSCGHYYYSECLKDYLISCNKHACCYCFKEFDENDYTLINDIDLFNKLLFFTYNTNKIDKLISLGSDINTKDSDNKTILMYALQFCKDSEVIKKLIEPGADTSNLCSYDYNRLQRVLGQSD